MSIALVTRFSADYLEFVKLEIMDAIYLEIIEQLEALSKHDFAYQLTNGRSGKISWHSHTTLYDFEDQDRRYCLSVEVIAEDIGIIEDSGDIIIATDDSGKPSVADIVIALQDVMKACANRLEIVSNSL